MSKVTIPTSIIKQCIDVIIGKKVTTLVTLSLGCIAIETDKSFTGSRIWWVKLLKPDTDTDIQKKIHIEIQLEKRYRIIIRIQIQDTDIIHAEVHHYKFPQFSPIHKSLLGDKEILQTRSDTRTQIKTTNLISTFQSSNTTLKLITERG